MAQARPAETLFGGGGHLSGPADTAPGFPPPRTQAQARAGPK